MFLAIIIVITIFIIIAYGANSWIARFTTKKKYDIFVINLDKHKDRLKHFDKLMKTQNIPYTRIEAVDGKNMPLEKWPCADAKKLYQGTKALFLSNLKVLEYIKEHPTEAEWFMVFEDDSVIPKNFIKEVDKALRENSEKKVVVFDERAKCQEDGYPKWTTCCILYHKSLIPMLEKELNWKLSEYMQSFLKEQNERICEYDIYLYKLLKRYKVPTGCIQIVKSDTFPSSIGTSIGSTVWQKLNRKLFGRG